MTVVLLILAFVLIAIGIAGAFLPVIPGPPLAFLGLLAMHYAGVDYEMSSSMLWLAGISAVIITVLDYVIPIWGTKKFGGTKWGTRGSTIGLLAGLFGGSLFGPLAPFAIILGPFFGAVIGELIGGASQGVAFKSGLGAFLGFLAGVFIKFVYAFWALLYFAWQLIA